MLKIFYASSATASIPPRRQTGRSRRSPARDRTRRRYCRCPRRAGYCCRRPGSCQCHRPSRHCPYRFSLHTWPSRCNKKSLFNCFHAFFSVSVVRSRVTPYPLPHHCIPRNNVENAQTEKPRAESSSRGHLCASYKIRLPAAPFCFLLLISGSLYFFNASP